MVWCLLNNNISKGQLAGYILANMIGLSVILVGLLFFTDGRHSNQAGEHYFSDEYIVLSKKVAGIGFTPSSFNADELADLQQQPWVKKIGQFTASQFAVNAGVTLGGRALSTYIFFESVPDEFFDEKPRDWQFNPAEKFVPIMLSRDYLALYNFGFAMPQGLPQVSEEVIGAIPVTLRITGRDLNDVYYDAAVVGFSSRLNTIVVPQSFMDWANEHYGPGEVKRAPSRLIIQIDQMKASGMEEYLQVHDYDSTNLKGNVGAVSDFLSIMSGVVTINGVVISLLALFILVLSIFLLIQKNHETMRKLMLLGYTPGEVARYYEQIVWSINTAVTLMALLITLGCRLLWSSQLAELGLGGAPLWPLFFSASIYWLVVSSFNVRIIRRKIRAIWNN